MKIPDAMAMLLAFSLCESAFGFNLSDGAYVNSKWGLIDRTGKVVIQPEYSDAGDFSEGLASVKVGGTHQAGGKYGFINRTGQMVIAPQFAQATCFREGLAAVRVDDKWGFVDRKGQVCIQPRHDWVWPFSEGLAAFREEKKCGFIDRHGEVVIPARYEDVFWGFREGLAPVAFPKQSKDVAVPGSVYGYIDVRGRTVIEPQFDRASQFSLGRAIVQIGETRGFIGRSGELISTTQDPIRIDTLEWSRGLARVLIGTAGEKVGFVDGTGTMVIPPAPMFSYGVRYSEADNTVKGLWSSPQDDIAEGEFDPSRAWNTAEGLTRIWSGSGDRPVAGHIRYGFADGAGKVVVKPQFEEVGDFSEGLAKFAVNLNWDVVGESGGFEPREAR